MINILGSLKKIDLKDLDTINSKPLDFTAIHDSYYYKDFVIAGDGNDKLLGTSGDDKIYGKKGDDLLEGKAGKDILIGGIGQDTLKGGTGDDVLGGQEYLEASGVEVIVYAYTSFDANWKPQGNNYLDGEDGNDKLIGGSGDDTLLGGNGNDTLNGGSELLYKPTIIYGNYGHYDYDPYGRNKLSKYSSGKDILEGGNGNDSLWGKGNSDTLTGGDGDDYLNGGDGNDILTGGSGADIFSFKILFPSEDWSNKFSHTQLPPIPEEGIDLIKDFDSAQGDKIKIKTVGVGEVSIDQFDYNHNTGSLLFEGQQFAQLEGNPNFSLQQDLIL